MAGAYPSATNLRVIVTEAGKPYTRRALRTFSSSAFERGLVAVYQVLAGKRLVNGKLGTRLRAITCIPRRNNPAYFNLLAANCQFTTFQNALT